MSTWKVGRALRTAGFVASALSGGTALAQTSPYGIAFDLRAPGTGGKQVTVNTIGETVFLDLYVTVFGQDANPRNEALQVVSGGFRSSAGGLGGDLLGLTPVAPFDQTSRPGLQSDPDGDGDLDVVGSTTNIEGWYFARSSSPTYAISTAPYYVGRARFTTTSLTGGFTEVNWVPRLQRGANFSYDSIVYIDGLVRSFHGSDPEYSIGAPVVIRSGAVVEEGPVEYLSGTINQHLTVTGNVKPQPGGSPLVLAQGIDVTPTGNFDTRSVTGYGAHEVFVRDSNSANAGGTLRTGRVTIGSPGGAVFDQGGGFTQIGSALVVGDATGSGRLNVSGGTLLIGAANIGNGGSNGVVHQTGGVADVTSLVLGNGSGQGTYELVGGNLAVSGDAFIAEGGGGTLHQSGGMSHFGASLYVGGDTHATTGTLRMSGGVMTSADILRVGTLGAGDVNHTGGEIRGTYVVVGDTTYSVTVGPAGRYTISGTSRLLTSTLNVGRGGNGVFVQNGGDVVSGTNLIVSAPPSGSARYELHNGSLRSRNVNIAWAQSNEIHLPLRTGVFIQDGGSHVADRIEIRNGGEYRHTGGVLVVKNQLTNAGTLNFGNTNVTLTADPNAFINLAAGTLAGHDNVNFVGAAGTLFSFPAGFDPFTQLGSFTTQGLVHVAGQGLAIPEGHSVSGSGTIEGTVTNAGDVNPGNSPGVLVVDGNYTQLDSGALHVALAGTDADLFDALGVVGAASLDGTLDVLLLDGFVPSSADTFTILTASSLAGMFTNAPEEIVLPGGIFDVLYGPTSVTLANFQAIPEPGSLGLLALAPILLAHRRRRYGAQ